MIILNQVTKAFDGRKVIDGLSIEIPEGELFVVIGSSGTGKSVTLRLISGQMQPTTGSVIVNGQNLATLSSKELEHFHGTIGYLFQSGALLGWMTLAENIALPLQEHHRCSKAEIAQKVSQALEDVGLADAGDRYPSEVSGGMLKRASFARAIIEQPQIVLFDEPTSGLDPVMSRTINELILKLNKKYGMTCVVVTHDLIGALQYADRIGMLSSGQFVEVSPPSTFEQSNHPEVEAFLKAQVIDKFFS